MTTPASPQHDIGHPSPASTPAETDPATTRASGRRTRSLGSGRRAAAPAMTKLVQIASAPASFVDTAGGTDPHEGSGTHSTAPPPERGDVTDLDPLIHTTTPPPQPPAPALTRAAEGEDTRPSMTEPLNVAERVVPTRAAGGDPLGQTTALARPGSPVATPSTVPAAVPAWSTRSPDQSVVSHAGRRGLVPIKTPPPARNTMPDSLRKALRVGLTNQLRAVNAAWRALEARQADLVAGLADARAHGFPETEVDRIRGEAVGLGFATEDIDELWRASGWVRGQDGHEAARE